MPRISGFNSPYLLGFEQLEQLLDSVTKNAGDGYPPYNIEHIGDNAIRISLALAGFSRDDIDISLEANQLVIQGRQQDDSGERVYLHRGIAARQFLRKFVLADGMKVTDAFMENGLLHIDLLKPEQDARAQKIKIRNP